jgi:hypothetical protein
MFGQMPVRYGAWSLDPYNAPTAMGVAMNTAMGLGAIQNQWGRNQALNQQNQITQGTMPGLIGAQNAQNSGVMQTMPGLIDAQNAQNAANARYAMSNAAANNQGLYDKNNLTNAQTYYTTANGNVSAGVQDPSPAYFHLKATYDNLPDGSFEKQYIGGLLNKMVVTTGLPYMATGNQSQPAPSPAPATGGAPSAPVSPPQAPQNPFSQPWSLGFSTDGKYYDNNWKGYSLPDLQNIAQGNS